MTINSRNKGACGEREFAGLIRDHLGVRLVRNLEQSRAGGHDLIVHPDESGPVVEVLDEFAFEVKRHARATDALVARWWRQTEEQARKHQQDPGACLQGKPLLLVRGAAAVCTGEQHRG